MATKIPMEELTTRLNREFGPVREENMRDDLFEHFTEPSYWPELRTTRACFLVGGRGMGKTTVLKTLSYAGQAQLDGPFQDWVHVGLYWRFDTNVVMSFTGGRVPEERWDRIFGHYVNLKLVSLVADFLVWAEQNVTDFPAVDAVMIRRACRALGIETASSSTTLRDIVSDAITDFEVDINNIDDRHAELKLSMQGAPLKYLLGDLSAHSALAEKTFFILLDEFENLTDRQQRCINTLIKHAGDGPFTFKIGVRETGQRETSTLNANEVLSFPADFALIDIADRLSGPQFREFAEKVCSYRLSRVQNSALPMADLLPGLSVEEEVGLLGSRAKMAQIEREFGATALRREFMELTDFQKYFVKYWSDSQKLSPEEALREFVEQPSLWRNRLNNHSYAMLFSIRRGATGIRKHYAGWDTMLTMANSNVRFLLELVGESLKAHLAKGQDLTTPVAYDVQTKAAQEVGGRIVRQMPSFGPEGASITQLVLGLGRVFGVMAASPQGHTPEVNQFRIGGQIRPGLQRVIDNAVMHLALVRFHGDKNAAESGDTRSWDYRLHPILSAFFEFSHRSKRRMVIQAEVLSELVSSPRQGINQLLYKRSAQAWETVLPEQMALFEDYYAER